MDTVLSKKARNYLTWDWACRFRAEASQQDDSLDPGVQIHDALEPLLQVVRAGRRTGAQNFKPRPMVQKNQKKLRSTGNNSKKVKTIKSGFTKLALADQKLQKTLRNDAVDNKRALREEEFNT